MGELFATLLFGVLALLLLSAGIEDARTREIANWKNITIALLAPLWWWVHGMALWPDIAIQVGIALLVFAFFAGAFALGQMGGGDVKLIGALALWLPVVPLMWMLVTMSLLGGGLTLLLVAEKWIRRGGKPLEIPYGVAIAIAALLVLREPIINHFG
jgi:prepilin peptidase CpaA